MNIKMPEIELPAFLAFKTIVRGNKGITFLTILVMTLVFINLSFVSGLFNGVQDLFGKQIRGTSIGDLFVEPENGDLVLQRPGVIQNKIEGIPGVVATSARYATGAQFESSGEMGTWNVFFVKPSEERQITIFDDQIVAGSYLEDDDSGQIVVGKEISGTHGAIKEIYSLRGLEIGDKITLTFNNGISKEFTVKGIYNTNFIMGDEFGFLTKNDMEEIFGQNGMATSVIVKTDDYTKADSYYFKLKALNLGGEVRTWIDGAGMIKSLQDTFIIFNIMLSSVAFMVAVITLFIVIYINTLSKKRQIGVLKAIGVTDLVIVRTFLFQALFYALVGIGMGVIIFYQFLVPYFVQNPLFLPVGHVHLVPDTPAIQRGVVGLLAAAIISGFFPAAKAVKEPMLDSIWGR
jgi:putative ABC transport system permease protein